MAEMLLFSSVFSPTSYMLIWVLGALFFILLCVMIYRQRTQGKMLRNELDELDKILQSNVEYEFVLKAMKIAIWHYNAVTKTFVFEHDFREGMDNYVPSDHDTYIQTLTAISPTDIEHVNKAFSDICEGRSDVYHQEYQVINRATGKSYWEESFGTVVDRDDEGKPLNIVGTSMRVDKRKEMEQALILARNKAEESDRLKTAFLANIGHEIRTPLNAIVGFADLLPIVQSEEDRMQLITEIQDNNRKLLRIINGLVSMSEIEAGARSLSITAVNLNEFISQVVAQYQPTTAVPISTHMQYGQMLIHTDRDVLTEIIDNLMQNAVKFTTKGSITIGYDIEADQLKLWVSDTGKGIAKENQKRIFERFVKVDEYIPGTGIGLSVVQSHVQHLGGTVGVDSELGKGSCFWVMLPIT